MNPSCEFSIEAVSAVALIFNVLLNNTSINHFKLEIVQFIGDVRAYNFLWYLVVVQTILSLFAIAIMYNRSVVTSIRTGLILAVLGLLFYETSSTFLFILLNSDQSRKSFKDISIDDRKYRIIIFFGLICYFAFKTVATVILFFQTGKLTKNINRMSCVDDFDAPPPYDSHMMESASTPPPSYYSTDYI